MASKLLSTWMTKTIDNLPSSDWLSLKTISRQCYWAAVVSTISRWIAVYQKSLSRSSIRALKPKASFRILAPTSASTSSTFAPFHLTIHRRECASATVAGIGPCAQTENQAFSPKTITVTPLCTRCPTQKGLRKDLTKLIERAAWQRWPTLCTVPSFQIQVIPFWSKFATNQRKAKAWSESMNLNKTPLKVLLSPISMIDVIGHF